MSNEKLTYYIRHTADMGIDEEVREFLCAQHTIAIHYPHRPDGVLSDNASLEPDDYHSKHGRTDMRILKELAENGGYICAEYAWRDDCLIGYVEPGTERFLKKTRWPEGTERPDMTGKLTTLRCLRIDRHKWIKPVDQINLLVGRPRQGTIRHWRQANQRVELKLGDIELKPSIGLLFDSQQEVMCAEFLRLPEAEDIGLPRLAHELLPIGRTLRDLDIYALAEDGKPIYPRSHMRLGRAILCKRRPTH